MNIRLLFAFKASFESVKVISDVDIAYQVMTARVATLHFNYVSHKSGP